MIDLNEVLPKRTYQRIVRDGVQVRRGSIDTQEKFRQMFRGDRINGNVLDVGCNFGEMTALLKASGARYVLGIDKDPENIRMARLLHPDIGFTCSTLDGAVGRNWDLIVCSAVLHYMPSLSDALRTLARLGTHVVGDICLVPGKDRTFGLDEQRELIYPTASMFERLASKYWANIFWGGEAPAPDLSYRRFFCLEGRMPDAVPAAVIWGPGGAGKTTMARDLESGQGYRHLQTDAIFIEWRQTYPGTLSNMDFVDSLWKKDTYATFPSGEPILARYLEFHSQYIRRWIEKHNGLPLVIEGYDVCAPTYRSLVLNALTGFGYCSVDIQGIELPARAK